MTAVSIDIAQSWGLTWPHWKRLVAIVEELGFAGLYCSDHFVSGAEPDHASLEPLMCLSYLASNTQRVHFGPLVAPVSFRDPVMLARQALALDDLSGGRMVLGLGAGWMEREHTMFGYDLGDLPARFDRFAEALEVTTRLLHSDQPTSFAGQYYQLNEAILLPRPQRLGGPPIMVGGSGPKRTLPLAARYADIWNARLTPDVFRERSAQLDALMRAAGRRPEDVRRTVAFWPFCGRDAAELERRLSWFRRTMPSFAKTPLDKLITTLRGWGGGFIGTISELVEYIRAYADAGVDEVILEWVGIDDIEGLEVLAREVLLLVA